MNETPPVKHLCCEEVREAGSSWPRYHKCGRTASFERDGKWYCKTHDPVARRAKADASMAAWRAERDAREAKHDRTQVCIAACKGIPDPASAIQAAKSALELAASLNTNQSCPPENHAVVLAAMDALNLLTPSKP